MCTEQKYYPYQSTCHTVWCTYLSHYKRQEIQEFNDQFTSKCQIPSTYRGPCLKHTILRLNKQKDTVKKTHLRPHKHPENCSKIRHTKFKYSLIKFLGKNE